MSVVQLANHRTSDTIRVLRGLLEQAQAGQLTGLALCFKMADGSEDAHFTGDYRAEPGRAVNAAMRLSWRLTQLQDGPLP